MNQSFNNSVSVSYVALSNVPDVGKDLRSSVGFSCSMPCAPFGGEAAIVAADLPSPEKEVEHG